MSMRGVVEIREYKPHKAANPHPTLVTGELDTAVGQQ